MEVSFHILALVKCISLVVLIDMGLLLLLKARLLILAGILLHIASSPWALLGEESKSYFVLVGVLQFWVEVGEAPTILLGVLEILHFCLSFVELCNFQSLNSVRLLRYPTFRVCSVWKRHRNSSVLFDVLSIFLS